MSAWFGDYSMGAVVTVFFDACDQSGAAANLSAGGTLRIYRDADSGFETQAYTANGVVTGVSRISIDTDDAGFTAGFFAPGHDYHLVLVGAQVDGITTNAYLGSFSVENRRNEALQLREVSDATSTSVFELDSSASTTNDFYAGQLLVFTSGQNQGQARPILAYVGSTRQVTCQPFAFTPAVGDRCQIVGAS